MYDYFSKWYDQLNEQEFYQMWYDEVIRYCGNTAAKNILDLGCGSGRLLELLAPHAHRLTGVDLSEQMLILAQERLASYPVNVNLFCDDMGELNLPDQQYDIIISTCDSFNYLESEEKLVHLFQQVYQGLKSGGSFLFDMHSDYTFTSVFPTWSYADQAEDLSVLWNTYTEDNFMYEHFLTFFKCTMQGVYERFDEIHQQFFYSEKWILKQLEKIGFTEIVVETDFMKAYYITGKRLIYKMKKE